MMGVHQVTTRSALPSDPLLQVMSRIGTTQATRGADRCSVLTARIEPGVVDGFGDPLPAATSSWRKD
jgi:hypothetical protein